MLYRPSELAEQTELFAAVGGEPGIAAAISELHRRILADPSLAPAFAGIDLGTLRRHHVELIAFILGDVGPQPMGGRRLREAHRHQHITIAQFDAMINHLVASFVKVGVLPTHLAEIVKRLMWLQPHIVSGEAD